MRIARVVLMHRNQARHAAAFYIFRPHCMAGPFWRNHKHVNIVARLDQIEVNIQTMGKGNRRTGTNIFSDFIIVNIGLLFIRRQHHDNVAPFSRFGNIHDLKASVFSFGTTA